MNEYFIYRHRYNTVKTVKRRTVSTGQKGSKIGPRKLFVNRRSTCDTGRLRHLPYTLRTFNALHELIYIRRYIHYCLLCLRQYYIYSWSREGIMFAGCPSVCASGRRHSMFYVNSGVSGGRWTLTRWPRSSMPSLSLEWIAVTPSWPVHQGQ